MKIISTTGSKGKTTITRMLAQILHSLGKDTLRIDGQEVAINEEVSSAWTQKSSKDTYGLALSVCTGKLLSLFPQAEFAVLETSIGCWREGTGYSKHDIGVFANVFEEHLSHKRGIGSVEDIASAKSFVLKKITDGGIAVVNVDDTQVLAQIALTRRDRPDIKIIGYGMRKLPTIDVDAYIFIDDKNVRLSTGNETRCLFSASDVSWTFDAEFTPSLYNLLAVCSVLHAIFGEFSEQIIEAIIASSMSQDGGRLTKIHDDNRDVDLLLDYAHEENSIRDVTALCRKLSKSGRVIGVVRTSPRPAKVIIKTARVLGECLDISFVYNKYDGDLHRARDTERERLSAEATQTLYAELQHDSGAVVELVAREDEALRKALDTSQPGDVIFHMVHDNAKKSVEIARSLITKETTY